MAHAKREWQWWIGRSAGMFLTTQIRRSLLWLVLVLALAQLHPQAARAQASTPAQESGGIAWKTCTPPALCFADKESRQQWAAKNDCKFLEDVCEGTPPGQDNKGAKDEDRGFWGPMWDEVKGALVYGYEFVKGLVHGLKEQVTDLWDMVSDPGEVIRGLVELGKAFFNDFEGTLKMLAELLGQETIDTIKRATQCGAYDLGKVVGQYVNPGTVVKLAVKLAKYGGKLADAVKHTKRDLGCASFAAATLVLTPQGMQPIEKIRIGQQVQSRHERLFTEAPQAVTNTFARTAPGYWLLSTEFDQFKLTDEHPLWVQGKGWTQAQHITDNDVIAGAQGDVRVLGNEAIHQPLPVYNFSVAKTANYFVGSGAVWAHNASCDPAIYTKAWTKLTPHEKGFKWEVEVFEHMTTAGYEPMKGSLNPVGKTPQEAFSEWSGKQDIDGRYRRSTGIKDKDGDYIYEYVLVESKATGGAKNGIPDDTVAKLTMTKNTGRQMSTKWVSNHLDKSVEKGEMSDKERNAIISGLKSGGLTKRIYAQKDANGSTYHEIKDVINPDKKINSEQVRVTNTAWKPQKK
ncbi:polymorphic toxin-type HINT domain-containing protein [Verminephrobacter aporrectodeae]|uniref:polymorphic toxin-type HINT domain-containing protein n=1 Tax=Verminephrobacter aporrectodeae TaxID=1110389 RepID=UPI001F2951B5|nr:polymorphic toxin-type HINT domain-containing protein [Verminephrobacter aporrectodeae]